MGDLGKSLNSLGTPRPPVVFFLNFKTQFAPRPIEFIVTVFLPPEASYQIYSNETGSFLPLTSPPSGFAFLGELQGT